MTPEEFIAKFPKSPLDDEDHSIQENCLEDIACPDCGQRECFKIQSTIMATVSDDGTDRDESDCEWNDESPTECTECLREGKLSEFTIKGLDDFLRDIYEKDEPEDVRPQ